MFHTRRLVWLLALIPLLLSAACSSPAAAHRPGPKARPKGSAFPLTLRAANGDIKIEKRPTAVMSLSPTATEMLYAVGAGRQVKAVDEFSNYPAGAPRTKLDGLDPNVEAIASYKPDLVIICYDAGLLDRELGQLHIPVLYEPAATNLAQEYAEFTQIGEATGHVAGARAEVSKIKGEIASIVAGVHRKKERATYYYEDGVDPYYSVTSSTFVGSLLGLLGLHSIADSAKGAGDGYPELSAEFIVKADPDYIFLGDTICCHQSATTVAARPGWSVMSAVKDHRILGLNDNIASRWGPRVVILLREVAREIERHPVSS